MGLVYAEIELINADDLAYAKKHIIGQEEVKRTVVNALVDTGAIMLTINDSIKVQLGLDVLEYRTCQTADGRIMKLEVVGPIEVKFKNRRSMTQALVMPGDNEVLLGAIPMEEMDVLIHPARQELIIHPDHPYLAQMKLKGLV
jgi:clan AA aspartic protease